ncbi:hypothetical protein DIPPA_03196 [Diplonema papillatum]|nr:hypothetical protein DIPPA_03196 [Diplonema papillatum]
MGKNMKAGDRFLFSPEQPGGMPCSESLADYHGFRDVSSTTAAEGMFSLDAGRWVLCYASIAWQGDGTTYDVEHTRFTAVEGTPLVVATIADYFRKSLLDELGDKHSADLGVDLAGINLGSCAKDAEKGLRTATFDVEDHHWGPVSGLSNAGESIDFGSVGSKRYLKGQTCVVPLAPRLAVEDAGGLQSEGKSAVKHLVVSFASFAVDETDTVLVFGDASKVGIDGVLKEQTAGQSPEVAGVRVVAGTLATPNCPRQFNGLELIASYSGTQRPAGGIRARLDLQEGGQGEAKVSALVVLVVCTDLVDGGGTGFSARVGLDTRCPNDCADASGVVRGSCVGSEDVLVGRCECVEGWTGESCSERKTCQGSQSSSAVQERPQGAVDTFVAASSTCGFLVQPDPSLNPLNCTTNQCTAYHCTTYQCTINQCTTNQCTAYQCTAYQCTAYYCTTYHCTINQCTTNQCTAYYCTTYHCTINQCTTNQCTAYQCTAYYCTTYHCTINQCTTNQCTAYYCTTYHCTINQCTTNQCTAYQCTTYHCTINQRTHHQCPTNQCTNN